jgi:GAF domain-containing protein
MDAGSGASGGTERLAEAFAELVVATVGEFDVLELSQVLAERCVDVLDVAASGLALADGNAGLQVMAASNEQAKLLELFQIQHDEGPSLESYRRDGAIVAEELAGGFDRWPRFGPAAANAGFSSVVAVPMRAGGKVIGALNLYGTVQQPVPAIPTARVAQAMADVTAVAIEQVRLARDRVALIVQLESALESRVAIEQAKGFVAYHLDIGLDEAFVLLRHRARSSRRLLNDVALDAIDNRGHDYTASGD